jgi:hypothetical protein
MQINWPIITTIIIIITNISAPLLQVVFASWYTARITQPNPKPETKRTTGRTRTSRFLSTWGSPIVLCVANVAGLINDFKTLHPPLVVRDVLFVSLHVAGLVVAGIIVAVMSILNLMGRVLDVQGRLVENHLDAIDIIDRLGAEVSKKADSRRRSK